MSIVVAALLLVTFTIYGEALKACDDANKQILPKLDDQVKAAGKLAVETTEQLATNKQVAISQISNEAVRPLYSAVEETDISVRDVFFQVIRDATDESIARVERHESVWKNCKGHRQNQRRVDGLRRGIGSLTRCFSARQKGQPF